jgi:hypothetical protein
MDKPHANEILSFAKDLRDVMSYALYMLDAKIREVKSEDPQNKIYVIDETTPIEEAVELAIKENQEASAELQEVVSDILTGEIKEK